MHFWPRFWGFWIFLGILRFLWNCCVECYWFDGICSCIAFSLHFNNVLCILDVCLIILECVLVGLDWVFTHDAFIFCILHVHAFFMYTLFLFFSFLCFLSWSVLFFLSLSDRLCHGTQSAQIHFGSEFWVFFFFWSYPSSPHSVLWWEGLKRLLGELSETLRSSGVLCYSIRFFLHSSPWCHSDSGLGFSTWEAFEVSHHVYIGVLLQYTWYWYLCISFCHDILRYTYRSYPRSYIRGTTCPEGSASWLPRLWTFSDCVQR